MAKYSTIYEEKATVCASFTNDCFFFCILEKIECENVRSRSTNQGKGGEDMTAFSEVCTKTDKKRLSLKAGILREGVLFFIFSNLVTVVQYIIYAFLPHVLGVELAAIEFKWPSVAMELFDIDFTWNVLGYDVIYGQNGEVMIGGGLGYLIAMLTGSIIAQIINFILQRNITFRSNGNPWYQAMWYFLGWSIITVIVNSINCVWVAVANHYNWPNWLYNIGSTFMMGGVSMVVFFFLFRIIFKDKDNESKTKTGGKTKC